MKFESFENNIIKEKILSGIHESGLRIYLIPKKGFSKYYAIYGTDFGSCDTEFTPGGENEKIFLPDGIAHFLEHKLFEEADGKNAFDRFSLTGANANAYTSFDITAYLFSCTDKFYENLEILLDFVNHPYFTDENVEKEQGIIGQEIKMYDDEPSWRVFFNMLGAMYHNNPVKIDIAGTVESIAKITPELLYKCTDNFYHPSNMALVMVGDIDEEKAISIVDKYVSKTTDGGLIRHTHTEPFERAKEFVYQNLSVSMPIFMIGFKDNEKYTDGYALSKRRIMTQLLLEIYFGQSSDFYMTLYNKGLINTSFSKETELEKSYGFTALSGESKSPEEVYEFVKDYINDLKDKEIDEDSLLRAKRILIGKNLKAYNSVENIGNSLIKVFFNGENPLFYNEITQSITSAELKERFLSHFDTDNCVLSVVKPLEEK